MFTIILILSTVLVVLIQLRSKNLSDTIIAGFWIHGKFEYFSWMAYEYFLQSSENKEPQQVSIDRVLAVFAPFIVKRDATYIDLEFDEMNRCTVYLEMGGPGTDSLMISRPCGVEALVRCIYEVMRLAVSGLLVYIDDSKIHRS